MLITEHFVLLNAPKTGSTFIRTVIKEIYAGRNARRPFWRRWLTKEPYIKELNFPPFPDRPPSQHGNYRQIPDEYRDREVVAAVRNPYSWFLSHFRFRWWAEHPPLPPDLLASELPKFPTLSLDDFARFNELLVEHCFWNLLEPKVAKFGWETIRFVEMFARQPDRVYDKLHHGCTAADLRNEFIGITFLRQERLSKELAAWLSRRGFTAEEVRHSETRRPVNVTEDQSDRENELWTARALNHVKEKEAALFRILEALGFRYEAPIQAAGDFPFSQAA